MKPWTPVTQIALGLSCVSVSLLLTGVTLGLVPDERSAAMAKRVSLAEALVSAMSFRDPETVEHSRRVSDPCMTGPKHPSNN